MIRLFVAITLPESIRKEVQGMGRAIPNGRPVPEDQLHLTLKFIGEVEGSRLLDIQEALASISHRKLSICLQGVGTFPPRGNPRILWAGVEPAGHTIALRNSIEKKLLLIGIAKERKKFTPHITLARLNNSPIRQVQQYLAGNAFLHTETFTVNSFELYSSQLTGKGALHRLENSFPLTS